LVFQALLPAMILNFQTHFTFQLQKNGINIKHRPTHNRVSFFGKFFFLNLRSLSLFLRRMSTWKVCGLHPWL
jgi:hypothetical protein